MTYPCGITVLERGWLSSNNILVAGRQGCALVDSGYASHSIQTLELLHHALAGRPLTHLVNTHLHSDHCGGNAAIQQSFGQFETIIPPGLSDAVIRWDRLALGYLATGQDCPRFAINSVLQIEGTIKLGDYSWEVVPVGGHDPHSVVLFQSDQRVLISADNLWENGFGVVFSELEGVDGFRELGRSLDRIESLRATLVIPGHGRPFTDIAQALVLARKRLAYFTERPERHFLHAARVLLKFKLLDLQQTDCSTLVAWAQATPYMNFLQERAFSQTMSTDEIVELLVADLIKANAAERDGGLVQNIN